MSKVRDEKFTGCADCQNFRVKSAICRRCACGEEFEPRDTRGSIDEELTWGGDYDE
ncbi:hypothetical protein [Magnetospirillum molischianum]|uniref:Uncharacterized protein n=1 Tax=Magnetospirillum molischianum DSM 120 TaxID=1150626 RepID=H8FY33_MAGML|nr:hypothetical protein [Magnetospirillum molischianum]CCG43271.1 hypothetical protein PHAMO_80062 [Magnetospirillum molischianum DSM 120]